MVLVGVNFVNRKNKVSVTLRDGDSVRVGRQPERATGETIYVLTISWLDKLVSRNHFLARRQGETTHRGTASRS